MCGFCWLLANGTKKSLWKGLSISVHFRVVPTVFVARFYAGDQEALFKEAHLVHPRRKPVCKYPTKVQTPCTARCGAAASPGKEFICEICMLAYAHSMMAGLECGHLFCHECWDSYLRVMVVCEGRAQTISCPATACDIVVDETTVLYVSH